MTDNATPVERATATQIVVDAGRGRSLNPDEVRETFTRVDGTKILDYEVETRGLIKPRIRRITLTVTAD